MELRGKGKRRGLTRHTMVPTSSHEKNQDVGQPLENRLALEVKVVEFR